LEVFKKTTEIVDEKKDGDLGVNMLTTEWREIEPVYFQSYRTKKECKDLIFGVSLQHATKGIPHTVPTFIKKATEAIETRGLDKEGIYRLSAKKGDVDALRIEVETDVDAVDFLNPDLDIHILTNLIKQYLREMPDPLFLYPIKERMEYSGISDGQVRLSRLRHKVKQLPKEKYALLEFIVRHLKRVTEHKSKHQMGVANLAMVFSGTLFQPSQDAEPSSNSWFKPSLEKQNSHDLNQMEFLKSDLVMEDLISNVEMVFGPHSPALPRKIEATSTPIDSAPPLPARSPVLTDSNTFTNQVTGGESTPINVENDTIRSHSRIADPVTLDTSSIGTRTNLEAILPPIALSELNLAISDSREEKALVDQDVAVSGSEATENELQTKPRDPDSDELESQVKSLPEPPNQ
jgi:hypothetical protein